MLKTCQQVITAMEAHQEWCISLGRFFCLALAIFFHVPVVATSGLIADIYEDHTIPFQNEILEINHTVVIHRNATLTIEPGVNLMFRGNGSLTIHGNLVANGTETSPIDISLEMDQNVNATGILRDLFTLRLVDGNGYNTGRLEILHQGVWGTVCDDGWSQINSNVACRQLGFSSGTFTREFPNGRGQIWLDDVWCTENDRELQLCRHRAFGSHDCGMF